MAEIIIYIVFLLLIIFKLQPYWKAGDKIREWANSNKYSIISKNVRFIRTGPFLIKKNSAVFRVEIKNKEQESQVVWIKIGDLFFDSNEFKVFIESKPKISVKY